MITRVKVTLVFVLCAIYSLIAGLHPFVFGDGSSRFEADFPWGFVPIEGVRVNDCLPNIVYFLPWGALCYLLLGSLRERTLPLIVVAAVVGGAVSFSMN